MPATENPPVPHRLSNEAGYDVDPGKGWVLFAGIMIGIVGLLNLVAGISAIDNAHLYTRHAELVLADLKTFGWILTVLGVLQLGASILIFRNSDLGRWAGIGFAGLNMITLFFFLPAYPFYAITLFFIDMIVIWGLIMYGGSDRRSLRG
jgi:hypothetical protein